METLYVCCAGLDVHKDTVVVCRRRLLPGGKLDKVVRTFGTVTSELLALSDWLGEAGVTHVAMESTGVYWKPVFNILEGHFQLILVNAQHIKQVPGRKTDVKDCEWIAQLLQHGLLKASFVPLEPIRDLRDLTRQRTQLVRQKASVANRIQKVLEGANIKLGSVATDVLGVSGRDMIRALIGGETDVNKLAELARRQLRKKMPALRLALQGRVTEHHRFLLQMHLEQVEHLEALIERLSTRITEVLAPFAPAVERLQTIPGVGPQVAEIVVAETGGNMEQFATASHLASWAGMCPGNNESAGKRRSGRMPKGNRWLKPALVQAAWASSRTKKTYLSSQFRRLAKGRGAKKALIAVAHTILASAYQILKKQTGYVDLGADYFDRLSDNKRLTQQLVRRLESLGHKVTLERPQPVQPAA